MTKRRSISKAMRVRIFDAAAGVCHLCKLPINATRGEKWHVEHVKPLWEGGSDDEGNMAPAHVDCHATKSAEEAAPRAKGTRQRASHIGIKRDGPKIASPGFATSKKEPRIDKSALPTLPRRNPLTKEPIL
jgi:5-methylcytosine-specific restriction protein A